MTINFRCEHCGKKVEAPDSAGGKRGKCPYCKQSCYIPMPVAEEDILELAPEADAGPGAEEEAVRRQERELALEMSAGDPSRVPLEHRDELSSEDVHHLVVNYCLDLAQSRLDRAERHAAELKKVPKVASAAVEEFISGKVREPALAKIPTKVLQAFLAQLRKSLAQAV